MTKSQYSDWSATAGSNTDIGGISLAENVMVPSAVNNALRELMAQLKAAGFISAVSPVFGDNVFRITGSSDATKLVALEADGLTTGTTRTLTVQDVNGTLYVSGGTDVPIADGGTGQSTKAAAFNALSPLTTLGDLLYGGASGAGTRLGLGTALQLLRTNAGATAPEWADAPASGGWTQIGGTTTLSGASTIISGLSLSSYRQLVIRGTGVSFGAVSGQPAVALSSDGTNYGTPMFIGGNIATAAASMEFVAIIDGIGTSGLAKLMYGMSKISTTGAAAAITGFDTTITGVIQALKFTDPTSGDSYDAGAITLWGIK